MSPKEVKAEIQSIRKAADKVMSSKESAMRFLSAVRMPPSQTQTIRAKAR